MKALALATCAILLAAAPSPGRHGSPSRPLSAASAKEGTQKLIPVSKWPASIVVGNKLITGPTEGECVAAGYRLLTPRPPTPAGQRIVSERIIQDPADPVRCLYDIVYEDIPAPPPKPPTEPVTNVPADRVLFQFGQGGSFKGAIWKDAPVTNAVPK